MQSKLHVCLLGWMSVLGLSPVFSLQYSKDPVYLTDRHGACGVVGALLAVADDIPEVSPHVKRTVQWLYDVRAEKRGGYAWKVYPESKRKKGNLWVPVVSADMATLCLAANRRWPDALYTKVARGASEYLYNFLEPYYIETRSGEGLLMPRYDGSKPVIPQTSGKFQGGALHVFCALYKESRDPRALRILHGLVNTIKDQSNLSDDGGIKEEPIWYWWPTKRPNKKSWRSGQCYGIAGSVTGLLEASELIPEHRFHDGTSILDLANAGLDWLARQSNPVDGSEGIAWPNVSFTVPTDNPGWGRGNGGVGYAFLQGYLLNKNAHPEKSKQYLEIARNTSLSIIKQIEGGWTYRHRTHFTQGGSEAELNLGFCGGVGGSPVFLLSLAGTVGEQEASYAERCLQASRRVAEWFDANAVQWPAGGKVWYARDKFGGRRNVNLARDYGLSGMIEGLQVLSSGLRDEKVKALTRAAVEALLSMGVQQGAGTKWPQFPRFEDAKSRRTQAACDASANRSGQGM